VKLEEKGALRLRQLRLLSLEPPLRTSDRHPFTGVHADQIPLELSHHAEHIEQQSADRIGRVVSASTETERDTFRGQFIRNVPRIPQ
jgi:hypothetical protein